MAPLGKRAWLGNRAWLAGLLLLLIPAGCEEPELGGPSTGLIPLIDLGTDTYKGFQGGLYPNGSNEIPPQHLAAALAAAATIQPLDPSGQPDPEAGLIVFAAIGASNHGQVFAMYERVVAANPERNSRLVLHNGTQGGFSTTKVRDPDCEYWQLLRRGVEDAGLSLAQIQVALLENGVNTLRARGSRDFPGKSLELKEGLAESVRLLYGMCPNLKLVYVTTKSYAGFHQPTSLEPTFYQLGFGVKWLIEDQINGTAANHDPRRGPVESPVLIWGPYLWADGVLPNGQELCWNQEDFENGENHHLGDSGEEKAAAFVDAFYQGDPTAQSWFWTRGQDPSHFVVDAEADATIDQSQPDTPLGFEEEMIANDAELRASFLVRFDVSHVPRPVLYASLCMRAENNVHKTIATVSDCDWDEATVTWNNAPAIDGKPAHLPLASRDCNLNFDVTEIVNADLDGRITFAFCRPDPGDLPYEDLGDFALTSHKEGRVAIVDARESGYAPRLLLISDEAEAHSGTK